jgi:protein-disulfide isomerase
MRSGVNATPTFFINNVRHDGSYDLGVLLTISAYCWTRSKTRCKPR